MVYKPDVECEASVEPGPVRVKVHPGLCEGWGNCHRWAPSVYPLDDEGYVDVHLVEAPAELAEAARRGAEVCPARAISVFAAQQAAGS